MRFCRAYTLVLALALSIVSSAQTPATCNVRTFQAPSGSTVVNPLRPSSINRYGTIVGVDANSLPFIRYNTGAIRRMSINIPGAYLFDVGKRNASGVTVGRVQAMDSNRNVTAHGFANSGSTTRLIDYPNATSTSAAGINMYGTIVGSFFGAPSNGNYVLKNGAFHTLQTPAEFQRDAEVTAISDTGIIIGNYALANSPPDPDQTMHGFVVINGTFHDLAYPTTANNTYLTDINAGGEIVGTMEGSDATLTTFIYKNGTFYLPKFVLPDGTVSTQPGYITGLNGYGKITGTLGYGTGAKAFFGSCNL